MLEFRLAFIAFLAFTGFAFSLSCTSHRFHGTGRDSEICAQGFNRSFCGRNIVRYGKGVYVCSADKAFTSLHLLFGTRCSIDLNISDAHCHFLYYVAICSCSSSHLDFQTDFILLSTNQVRQQLELLESLFAQFGDQTHVPLSCCRGRVLPGP